MVSICFTWPPCHTNHLQVAYCQLATLQHISNGGRLGEGAIPERFQPESYPLGRDAQEKKKAAGLPSPEVQVLLPVMGAAALQLAHAALACVRIMDSKILAPDGKRRGPSCLQLHPCRFQYACVWRWWVAGQKCTRQLHCSQRL
jgi:hypothetical protein